MNPTPVEQTRSANPGWLQRCVRLMDMSILRRPQLPALYEVYGDSAQSLALKRAKLVEATAGFGDTMNCVTILCGGGVATVIDTSNPVGRVICVIDGVRPRFGKAGLSAELRKFIEDTKLYEQRLGVRVVKKLTNIIRGGFKWYHNANQPNDQKLSHRRTDAWQIQRFPPN